MSMKDEKLPMDMRIEHHEDGVRSTVIFTTGRLGDVEFNVPRQSAEQLQSDLRGLDGSEAMNVILSWMKENSQNEPWSSSYAN